MAQISANRGDIAEGIMGAALTAKFIKRKLNQTVDTLPQVNATDIDAVLAKFFRSGGIYRKTVRDCLLYTSPSPRDPVSSRMPSSA